MRHSKCHGGVNGLPNAQVGRGCSQGCESAASVGTYAKFIAHFDNGARKLAENHYFRLNPLLATVRCMARPADSSDALLASPLSAELLSEAIFRLAQDSLLPEGSMCATCRARFKS